MPPSADAVFIYTRSDDQDRVSELLTIAHGYMKEHGRVVLIQRPSGLKPERFDGLRATHPGRALLLADGRYATESVMSKLQAIHARHGLLIIVINEEVAAAAAEAQVEAN